MPVDYSKFKAHPTKYKGIRFRSRLEATWAAFFDGMGWRWEYEPFDMNGWVPDFLIYGKERNSLVEVKPISEPDGEVIDKISEASGGDFNLILCGLSPNWGNEILVTLHSCCMCGRCHWMRRAITTIENNYDIVFGHWPEYKGFVTGINVLGLTSGFDEFMGRETRALWNEAKNKTQWRAPR